MRSTRIGPIKISTCSIRWVSSRKSPANIGGLCIYASLCPREIAMREISFEGAFQNCTNVNVNSKTDFWWNSIVWKNKIILNYTLIMDPTYYFHIFPVYITLDRLYIHLVQVNPDKKYRSLPGISVVLSVILYLEMILGHFIYLEISYSDLENGSTEVSQVQC